MPDMPGILWYGDNLRVLRESVADNSVDLVYLDPPFNSNRNYNLIHKGSEAQEHAFVDTWKYDDAADAAYRELVGTPGALKGIFEAFRGLLYERDSGTLAYLCMMAPRLVELHRVLKATGSLYLHCDPTASHYLKIILDAIFGTGNFRNEIIWKRNAAKSNASTRLPSNHDLILMYGKSAVTKWNQIHEPYDESKLDEKTSSQYKFRDSSGRLYSLGSLDSPADNRPNLTYEFLGVTRVWRWTRDRMQKAYDEGLVVQTKLGTVPRFKRYLDEQKGRLIDDVWTDIPHSGAQAAERMGYPTQKPLKLLERIISASSNPGDIVLDPFCGCGTTVEAAERLGRKWIGIDVALRAVDIIKERLDKNFPGKKVYIEKGEPHDLASALRLAKSDEYDFQWWAVRKLGGRPPKGVRKKGGDKGVDGEILFREPGPDGAIKRCLVSVKANKGTPGAVRELYGTIVQEKAACGILVTAEKPSDGLRKVARDFGGDTHPLIQCVSAEDFFDPKFRTNMILFKGYNVTAITQPTFDEMIDMLEGLGST